MVGHEADTSSKRLLEQMLRGFCAPFDSFHREMFSMIFDISC